MFLLTFTIIFLLTLRRYEKLGEKQRKQIKNHIKDDLSYWQFVPESRYLVPFTSNPDVEFDALLCWVWLAFVLSLMGFYGQISHRTQYKSPSNSIWIPEELNIKARWSQVKSVVKPSLASSQGPHPIEADEKRILRVPLSYWALLSKTFKRLMSFASILEKISAPSLFICIAL